jgi:hypothetical protein
MKYVVVDEQGGPVRTPWTSTWLDPRPYLSELPNLEADLPPGARALRPIRSTTTSTASAA